MIEIKRRPIRVLLLDDEKICQDSFQMEARKERIITDVVDNVEDLLSEVKNKPKHYQFLVLDAKSYLHEGQKPGMEDEAYLTKALTELQKLKYEVGINIPYCINTGFSDLKLRFGQTVDCPIFEKGNGKELFAYIWDTYSKSDRAKLINLYPGIFSFVFDNFGDVEAEAISDFYNTEKFRSNNIVDRKDSLNCLRSSAEHLTDILHDKYLGGSPDVLIGEGSRLKKITDYLNDRKDIPVHIYSALTSIRKVAGHYGTHNPPKPIPENEYPSEDYITGLALSLRDVFLWAETKLN